MRAAHLLLLRRPEGGLLLHLLRLAEGGRLHRLAHLPRTVGLHLREALLLGGLPERARSVCWRRARLGKRVHRAGLLLRCGERVHGLAAAGLLLRE